MRVILFALLTLKLKSVDPAGGSKNLAIIVLAAVEPDVVIDDNDRFVDAVMEDCFPI